MNNKAKIVIAVICLAAAGVLVLFNMGIIGGGKQEAPPARTNAPAETGTDGGATQEQNAGLLKRERI